VTDWSDYALLLVDVRRDFYPDLVAKPFPDLPGERVVTKQSFDGFLGTDLHEHLQAGGRRFLLVAGLVTSTWPAGHAAHRPVTTVGA
jgi:nicotinamidase-related amidase